MIVVIKLKPCRKEGDKCYRGESNRVFLPVISFGINENESWIQFFLITFHGN